MKIQCPSCKKMLTVPDTYRGRRVKCKGCNESFVAKPYKKPPIVVPTELPPVPQTLPDKENFVTKLWTRCPAAFRIGFLTTLGVVSALWVTFNFIGPGTWLRRPSVQKTFHTSPVPAGLKKADLGDIDFLAATIRFGNCLFTLSSLQRIRTTALAQFAPSEYCFGVGFLYALQCTQAELENLHLKIHNSIIPDNPDLQAVYRDILAAVDAEYVFQKKMMAYVNNPENPQYLSDLSEQDKTNVALYKTAMIGTAQLYVLAQEGLTDAIVRIDGYKE